MSPTLCKQKIIKLTPQFQQEHHAHFKLDRLWPSRLYYRGWTGRGKAIQMDCDTISLSPSVRQRRECCIPTAPYADISSDQRQLSPLCLNQRETLDRAHRWPAPDRQSYTTLLRWLQTWLWAETMYRIAHDRHNVEQNPSASFTQDAQSFSLDRKQHYQAILFFINNLYCESSLW